MPTDFILLGAAKSGLYLGDFLFILISFLILVALVGHFAWKPVADMMQKRSDKISNDIDNAEKSRQDAEKLDKQRQDALKNSQNDANKIIESAKDNGEKQRQTIITNAQQEAQTLRETAQKDIAQERQDALDSARNDVADISVEIATKIIGKQLNAADQKDLIDSYIEGLGKSNGNK
ncbi:F0F1 ATP synthase subunit B [Lactobacillus selangorensis]|uniref:ATP synthase subunit b n=1 Tax=Lactobacillus selangorensis TaxID=81857 RepID=A0A0R2FWI9_9LACO|nr:F0F1 ATP synthase subunit B [Lactobacillus selangorensis]KRN29309.1 F0F1 ATP synthase subunit B [Lactobacillus selangorensis]KRN34162.1 F0F1 ATP synthase subunit B [Lactobacillus selangorensis]